MTARRLTRRSMLAATGGAVVGAMMRPVEGLAALAGQPPPALGERWLGALPGEGMTIDLDRSADLLGVEWRGPADARVELRFRARDGRWSRWQQAGPHGHGPDQARPADTVVGDPVWTGGTTALALRATRTLSGVRLHLVDVSGGTGARRQALAARSLAALPLATPVLAAGEGQPPILARSSWAQGLAHPRVAPAYGAVRMAFVHHTENANGYSPGEVPAMLRAIFIFHRYVNGWNDIGYNFAIDAYGRIFEARAGGIDEPVVGAQAGGYNLQSTGVAVLGSFMSHRISPAARVALERLLAWKLSLHGVPAEGRVTVRVNPAGARYSRFPANAHVPLPRIAGHRDGDSTDCPGGALYGELPAIRQNVHLRAGRAARATLAFSGPPSPPAGGPPTSPRGPTSAPSEGASPGAATALVGGLGFLDGTPIAAAPIILQARSVSRRGEVVGERTIAEVVTDGEGRWSLPVSLSGARGAGAWLRALYPGASARGPAGAGAVVSDPLHLPAALSPLPAPSPTPAAAQPPAA
jgi:N-acetylmuramoyl-L-alanine amidase